MTGAATGRLSSSNPNLQNIPIRTEEGRRYSSRFRARTWLGIGGGRLLSNRTSIAGGNVKRSGSVDAFTHKRRHPHTHRSGSIQSESADGGREYAALGQSGQFRNCLWSNGVWSCAEPWELIARKPNSISGATLNAMLVCVNSLIGPLPKCVQTGVAKTMLGRRRPIPDMQSRNPSARSFAERTAVNTPLQGTAADVIKLAMIRIQHLLDQKKMQSRMLLQVHDELVFEAPPSERADLEVLIKHEMETVYPLSVPLWRTPAMALIGGMRNEVPSSGSVPLHFIAGGNYCRLRLWEVGETSGCDGEIAGTVQGRPADHEGRCCHSCASRLVPAGSRSLL